MWKNKKVSVVFPTYNEKDSIKSSIEEFFATGYVDEVIVVNNNAVEGTSKEISKTRAREVFENRQGYGYAIRKGLQSSRGDLIVISEPDGTFVGNDVVKLLSYSDDFDAVFGSRTNKNMIWGGANMGVFLKWGNWALAKLIMVLYNATLLTDVGCTMRLVSRKVLTKIQKKFKVGGSQFGPEMMILVILNGISYIEVPVNYKKRIGHSSVTGSRLKAFLLGIQMIFLIVSYRLKSWLRLI